ncbi:MAG: Sec-independent protein translocase protein TatB [Gammaproteobacteria bacterium]|nr:Sec-independent protein translocase protein TatB [Gammaproteobacteria bacterium]
MFDVGFWEILLIGTLGLLVLGPERLPKVARRLGRWTGQAKAMARSLRTQLESEMELSELKKQAEAFKDAMKADPTAKPEAKTKPAPAAGKPATEDPEAADKTRSDELSP